MSNLAKLQLEGRKFPRHYATAFMTSEEYFFHFEGSSKKTFEREINGDRTKEGEYWEDEKYRARNWKLIWNLHCEMPDIMCIVYFMNVRHQPTDHG